MSIKSLQGRRTMHSDGNPHNWGKNRDFWPVSDSSINHCWTVASSTFRRWRIGHGSQLRRLLIWKTDNAPPHMWTLFMTESLNVIPKTTEQNLTVCSVKYEAEVTSNKRLCLRYCNVEVNYWQTCSVTQPLAELLISILLEEITIAHSFTWYYQWDIHCSVCCSYFQYKARTAYVNFYLIIHNSY